MSVITWGWQDARAAFPPPGFLLLLSPPRLNPLEYIPFTRSCTPLPSSTHFTLRRIQERHLCRLCVLGCLLETGGAISGQVMDKHDVFVAVQHPIATTLHSQRDSHHARVGRVGKCDSWVNLKLAHWLRECKCSCLCCPFQRDLCEYTINVVGVDHIP